MKGKTSLIKKLSNKLKFPSFAALSKPKPALIPDVLDEIFRHLIDDRNTLRSCILVCRLWCRLIMPILWSDPFMKRNDYGYFAIRTYICCLGEHDKSLLRQQEIRIPKFPTPLFDYPSFLLIFNYNNFAIALEDFVTGNEIDFLYMNEKRMIISSVIVNMIVTRSRGIRVFDYYRYHLTSQIILTLDHSLSLLGGRKEGEEKSDLTFNSLNRIQTFKFNGFCIKDEIYSVTWPNLFNVISASTTNIQHLTFQIKRKDFSIQTIYNSIASLIKSQKSLKSFEINEIWVPESDKTIFDALSSQSHSLNCLKLYGKVRLSSLMELMVCCYNLNTLEVEEFYNHDYIPMHKYKGIGFSIKNLCYLHNKQKIVHADKISLLLQMISNNLKMFSCKYFCPDIFVNIKKYSSNLTNLRIIIKSCTIMRFSKVLSLMSSLKYLYLESPKEEYTLFAADMMHQLSCSLPYSLDHLSFNLSITQELLKIFLNGCSVHLTILELFSIHIPDRKFSSLIMEYHNRMGSLHTLKLSKNLIEKYNFQLHNKKKFGYKIIETVPEWFQDILI